MMAHCIIFFHDLISLKYPQHNLEARFQPLRKSATYCAFLRAVPPWLGFLFSVNYLQPSLNYTDCFLEMHWNMNTNGNSGLAWKQEFSPALFNMRGVLC